MSETSERLTVGEAAFLKTFCPGHEVGEWFDPNAREYVGRARKRFPVPR